MSKPVIAFIGGGNMATSLIGGLVQKGYPASSIRVSDPVEESRQRLAEDFAIIPCADNATAVANAAVVILAIKPQIMKSVAESLGPALSHRPVVISIAAGIPVSSLQQWLGEDIPIIRCMPNTPALVHTGAAGLFANPLVSDQQKQLGEEILNAVGISHWLATEADIDAVTALSGSGPAYFFLVMESMEKVGVELGLDPEVSRQLTLQTALGAAQMAITSDLEPAELRRRVTSPGGTTERAIETFLDGELPKLFKQAMTGAVERAREMAEELTD